MLRFGQCRNVSCVRRYHEKMRLREKNRTEDLRKGIVGMRNEGGNERLVESRKTERGRKKEI